MGRKLKDATNPFQNLPILASEVGTLPRSSWNLEAPPPSPAWAGTPSEGLPPALPLSESPASFPSLSVPTGEVNVGPLIEQYTEL